MRCLQNFHAASLSECGLSDPGRDRRPLNRKRRLGELASPFGDVSLCSPELLLCELQSPEPLDLEIDKLAADAALNRFGPPVVIGRDCHECSAEATGKEALLESQHALDLLPEPESKVRQVRTYEWLLFRATVVQIGIKVGKGHWPFCAGRPSTV